MQLLTAMGEDTGYRDPNEAIVRDGSNAGMERVGTWKLSDTQVRRLPRIIKDPRLARHLGHMAEQGHVPKHVIWCWRPLKLVAQSRFAANRPWFPDNGTDLSKIPEESWPAWATLQNQERAMAEVLGRLTDAVIGYGLRHTTLRFPDDFYDPDPEARPPHGHPGQALWRCLAGRMYRGSATEAIGWKTEDDLHRFLAAHTKVVRPELIRFG